MEGSDSEFVNFTLPTLKAFLEAECVWQKAITCCSCYRMPTKRTFSPQNRDLLVSQETMQRHFFPTLHPLSPIIFATATMVAFVLFRNSRFNLHCYTQHEAMPTQKLTQKWLCDLSRLLLQKITKGIHSCKPASLNRLIQFHSHCQSHSKLSWGDRDTVQLTGC